MTNLRNNLTGTIPSELGNLPNLSKLSLFSNVGLSGTMPLKLCRIVNGRVLNTGLDCSLFMQLNILRNWNSHSGNLLNWNTSLETFDEWEGVTVENGKIVELNLTDKALSGEIPYELGQLTNLRILSLANNNLTGVIPSELGNLPNLRRLSLANNFLNGSIPSSLGNLSALEVLDLSNNIWEDPIPSSLGNLSALEVLDLSNTRTVIPLPEELCSRLESNLKIKIDGTGIYCPEPLPEGTLIYNDNLLVFPVEKGTSTFNSELFPSYIASIYSNFADNFHHIVLISASKIYRDFQGNYNGFHSPLANDIQGIGKRIFSYSALWGSTGNLKGYIHIPSLHVSRRTMVHELMHPWANSVIPPFGHWGFSSVNGALGGFNIDDLVDHGENRYSARHRGTLFTVGADGSDLPYSPIELYLAGLIPPEEVPDIWVAEDGEFTGESTEEGHVFTASNVKTYTIEDIINEHGERVPNWEDSPKSFRVMTVVLIEEENPPTDEELQNLSEFISTLSHEGDDGSREHNFYEATGGRASLIMDGLSKQLLEDVEPIMVKTSPSP